MEVRSEETCNTGMTIKHHHHYCMSMRTMVSGVSCLYITSLVMVITMNNNGTEWLFIGLKTLIVIFEQRHCSLQWHCTLL